MAQQINDQEIEDPSIVFYNSIKLFAEAYYTTLDSVHAFDSNATLEPPELNRVANFLMNAYKSIVVIYSNAINHEWMPHESIDDAYCAYLRKDDIYQDVRHEVWVEFRELDKILSKVLCSSDVDSELLAENIIEIIATFREIKIREGIPLDQEKYKAEHIRYSIPYELGLVLHQIMSNLHKEFYRLV